MIFDKYYEKTIKVIIKPRPAFIFRNPIVFTRFVFLKDYGKSWCLSFFFLWINIFIEDKSSHWLKVFLCITTNLFLWDSWKNFVTNSKKKLATITLQNNYLLNGNSRNTRKRVGVNDVVLVFLLLTFIKFHTFF